MIEDYDGRKERRMGGLLGYLWMVGFVYIYIYIFFWTGINMAWQDNTWRPAIHLVFCTIR